MVRVLPKGMSIVVQGEAVERLHETIVNSSKDISIMSTTMGGMAQDLQSYGKEMEYYATKLHLVP